METTLLSVGVDIGTSTTSLVFSSLQVQNTAGMFTVPRMTISGKKLLYKSGIYSTPLLDEYRLDVQRIQRILETEYATAPQKQVVGEAKIEEILEGDLLSIWRKTKDHSGITYSFFRKYYKGKKTAVAYRLKNLVVYEQPRTLADIGVSHAPQSYRYMSAKA